jgi:small subunit ribosomal protein S17
MADNESEEETVASDAPNQVEGVDVDAPEAEVVEAEAADIGPEAGVVAAGNGGTPADDRSRRKVREGLVVSTGMDKTAVVAVIERVRHPRYVKTVQRTKRLYAHDEGNDARVGDRVRLAETRPLSKLKRWRLLEILERAK